MRMRSSLVVVLATTLLPVSGFAAGQDELSPAALHSAIVRAIPLLESGAAGSAEQRQCFTCHHQAIPVLALSAARRRGFAIDEDHLELQLRHTAAHLERGRKGYLEGCGQGGKVLTAGYALWTLSAGGRPADNTTAAVTEFLLEYQKKSEHWSQPGSRPPSSGSHFTATYLALRGLSEFGTDSQAAAIASRTEQVGRWLRGASPSDTEDRVFHLRTLPYLDASQEEIQKAATALIDAQRPDGGWGQLDDMESDAYATGTVLAALMEAADASPEHPAVRRGLRYLISTQADDGSWYVATRADGFQPYFESGFPYGEDQFISMAASSWATLAMLLALPETTD